MRVDIEVPLALAKLLKLMVLKMFTPGAPMCTVRRPKSEKDGIESLWSVAATAITLETS